MAKRVRLGVIGLGMGRAHCLAALQAKGIELAAIAEPQFERVENLRGSVGRKLGTEAEAKVTAIPVFDSYRDLVASGTVDAVVAALPTAIHAKASIELMKLGVHVLCEKPPTTSAAQMKRVIKTVEATGRTYMFVRQQRFEPAKFTARELVAKGKLGRVFHAESQWYRTCSVPWRGGWGVNKDAGGGVLLDLGIHKLDDAWFVLGCPKPVSVYAAMHCAYSHRATGRDLNMPYDADDVTLGMVRFEDGSTLNMAVTFALTSHGPDDRPITGDGNRDWQELRVFGSHAGVDIGRGQLIKAGKDDVSVKQLPIPKRIASMSTGLTGQLENFAKAIQTGTDPLNPASQALQLMQMLDALKKSALTGKSVQIS